jgi:hypothetical protein
MMLLALAASAAWAGSLNYLTDWQAALEQAKTSGKPILVSFFVVKRG